MAASLHPDLESLAFLLGTWRGTGDGHYPTIDSFRYVEELTFGHVGKPFIAYVQKTKDPDNDQPMHAETGYFRPVGPQRVELVLAQPSGIVEIDTGSIAGTTLDLTSVTVATSPSAKQVAAVRRVFAVEGDTLTVDLHMAAVGLPLQHHLRSVLRRA